MKYLVAVTIVGMLLVTATWRDDPQTDPCFCEDANGIWYTLPDVCCHVEGHHPQNHMDGVVDVNDFLHLIAVWGPCPDEPPYCCRGDINRDRVVDVRDMLIVIESWGMTTPWEHYRNCREIDRPLGW
jgi:hypothetical protein